MSIADRLLDEAPRVFNLSERPRRQNGPEILHLFRHELQHAVAPQGRPPTPRPTNASPWLAMSVMQKAIRRGREDLALNAAATLLRDAPEKLWRRIGCIAFEDVGVACLDAVGLATVALVGKRLRATLGGEWAVASCVVSELCRVSKCRAANDLLMACELHPAYAKARAELPQLTTRNLIAVATGQRSVHERALALWHALGTGRRGSRLVQRPGEPGLVFDRPSEAAWPHSIVELARQGFRREMLCSFVALLSRERRQATGIESDEFPAEVMIGGIPSWAVDIARGRGVFRWRVSSAQTRPPRVGCRAACRVAFLGHITFSRSRAARYQSTAVAARGRTPPPMRRRVLGSRLPRRIRNPRSDATGYTPPQRD